MIEKIKEKKYRVAFYALGILFLVFYHMKMDLSFGDVANIYGVVLQKGSEYYPVDGNVFQAIIAFTKYHYLMWSSRNVIEIVLIIVGILPQIFQDEELFPKKEDILDFANQVLGICLNIQSRRSRIEYIGTILCMVSTTSSENRSQLVEALDILLENDSTMREIKRRKKEEPNFSWNEAILKLGKI